MRERLHIQIICVAALVLFLTGQLACEEATSRIDVHFVTADGKATETFHAEIASTPSARTVGLMHRHEMGKREGMLFVFPGSEPRSFWMKNTYLELDMIFINSAESVVSVVKRAKPLTTTARLSGESAQYVLEVLGGEAEALGITSGSKVIFGASLPRAS